MLSLAINTRRGFPQSMGNTISAEDAERRLMGRALARLRERASMTQYEAAVALGMSTQGWQAYEAGKRRFTDDQIASVAKALGYAPDDLMIERARLIGQDPPPRAAGAEVLEIQIVGRASMAGVDAGAGEAVGVIDLKGLRSSATSATRIADETMTPWGEPGEIVIFDRDRWPRRGTGCVVETIAGQLLVKIYERSDDGQVHLRQFNPDQLVSLARDQVKGVYAIRLRGD